MDTALLKFTINTIWPVAEAGYLSIRTPPPPLNLPDGFELIDLIKMDPTKAEAALAKATDAIQGLVTSVVKESNLFGIVAYNAQEKTAIVSVRGSQTIWDWIYDLVAVPVPWADHPECGLVHLGFEIVYLQVRDSIKQLVDSCPPISRLIFTGHSLGAAVATLAAYEFAKNTPYQPELFTLASPRVGDPVFVKIVSEKLKDITRIVNFGDIVPQVPPPPYWHVGEEVLVHGGFSIDPKTTHSINTYLTGLENLWGPAPTKS